MTGDPRRLPIRRHPGAGDRPVLPEPPPGGEVPARRELDPLRHGRVGRQHPGRPEPALQAQDQLRRRRRILLAAAAGHGLPQARRGGRQLLRVLGAAQHLQERPRGHEGGGGASTAVLPLSHVSGSR